MDSFRSVRDVLRAPAVPVREVTMNVYNLIAKVSHDLCQQGIAKDRRNTQQGYGFRGIDDVYNALAPIISKHGLVILPRVISREVSERMGKSGSSLFYVVVEVEFDFVSSHDGTKHTVKTFGEAMDSGDKATNKAMSAAYKYAAFQTFCIPTEGDNDADAITHETHTPEFTNKLMQIAGATKETLREVYEALHTEFKGHPELQKAIVAAKDQRKTALGIK